jgi:hypothetical protein
VGRRLIGPRPTRAINSVDCVIDEADRRRPPCRQRIAVLLQKPLPFCARCAMSAPRQQVAWECDVFLDRNAMSFMNGNSFADRQAAAAKARKAMAEKFLANSKYDPTDPAVIEREAKRKAILEARKVRDVERAKRKAEEEAAEAARLAAEEAARQEQLRLEALAREAELQRQREEEERLEYERKLERDARYAARKERKKRKSAAERYG